MKIKQITAPLVVILLLLFIVFVYVLTQSREKFTGAPDVTANTFVEVKYVIEDEEARLSSPTVAGYTTQINDYTIHRGKVNDNATDIEWLSMTLKSGTEDKHTWNHTDNGDPVWKADWFGSGNNPPKKFKRFPTLAQLKSGAQPARIWPAGKVTGNMGVDGDKCSYKKSDGSGDATVVDPTPDWWCKRSHPDGEVVDGSAARGDVCDSGLDLVIPDGGGKWYCPSTLRYMIGSGKTWELVTTNF